VLAKAISNLAGGQNTSGLACCLFYAGFLLGLLINPEDGGDMFLRNVSLLSAYNTTL
jgi:hypothetical protein